VQALFGTAHRGPDDRFALHVYACVGAVWPVPAQHVGQPGVDRQDCPSGPVVWSA
jgi:hypothetical protein